MSIDGGEIERAAEVGEVVMRARLMSFVSVD